MKYRDSEGNLQEIYLPPTGDTMPIGSVVEYAGSTAPANWLFVGTEVLKTDYPELYSVLGDIYNDENTPDGYFKVYNKKGLVTVGIDADDSDFDTIGKKYGEKEHTLVRKELPNERLSVYTGKDIDGNDVLQYTHTAVRTLSAGSRIGQTEPLGEGQAHNNVQPSIVGNFICKAKNSVGLIGNITSLYSESAQGSYACDYINNLKKEVWVNSDTTKGFAEQSLTLDEGYKYYMLVIKRYSTTNKLLTFILYPNSINDISYSDYDDSKVRAWNREVTISEDGKTISFGNNTINGAADSSGLIPYKIYGCNL